MTMTMDHQQRQFGPLGYDHTQYSSPPQFTNPWTSTTSTNTNSHLFPSNNTGYDSMTKQTSRATGVSVPYSSMPTSTSTLPAGNAYSNSAYGQPSLLGISQDLLNPARSSYDNSYTSAPSSSMPSYAPTSAPYGGYGNLLHPQMQQDRRLSQSSSSDSHVSYDALDAGRGMVAMSQDLTTPRNIYGHRSDRAQTDSYGFPSAHSSASSVSSASTYPYYAESVGSSVTDYSSSSESMEPSSGSRRLPRPSGLIAGIPPAPQTMMGQFNSKVSSSTQKKHKCKVCQKAFTRPSSLQTHIYSHTGEKPYACGFEGCGRQFSVVSNLRRHRKVHKADRLSHPSSPEGSWASER